jgi:hypothetical protein
VQAPAKRDDWMIRAPPRDLLFGSDPKAADQNEAEAGKPRAAEVQVGLGRPLYSRRIEVGPIKEWVRP